MVCGASFAKFPKTIASKIAPIDEHNQPIRLIPPYNAKVDGSKKIPEPIIFPMTKAVLDQKPIFLDVSIIGIFLILNNDFKNRKKKSS